MQYAAEIVQGFMQAMSKGDTKVARKHLADDLSFRGPIDTFKKPESAEGATLYARRRIDHPRGLSRRRQRGPRPAIRPGASRCIVSKTMWKERNRDRTGTNNRHWDSKGSQDPKS
jgi:hypothetical protein